MAMPSVRNLSDELLRASRKQAGQPGVCMEVDARNNLARALSPTGRVMLGSLLAEIGRQARLSDAQAATVNQLRDKAPARIVRFDHEN